MTPPCHRCGRMRGLSLIELMVALVLGLLLTAAVLQVYLATKRTFVTQDQLGQQQEGGRYALDHIARDLRMAGLFGCASRRMPGQPLPIRNHLADSAYPYDLTPGVRGYEAVGTAPGQQYDLPATDPPAVSTGTGWAPTLPARMLAGSARIIAGSDVLVITGASPLAVPLVDPYTSGAQIFVRTPHDFGAGDILLVTDCLQAQIFQATAVSAGGHNITGAAGGPFAPGNGAPIATRGPIGPFRAGAEVSALRSHAYYVGVGSDGTPTLFRERLAHRVGAAAARVEREELISGVESMQLLYGVDPGGNFRAEDYVTADAVSDWQQVRAVRIALLVRSPGEFAPEADSTVYVLEGTRINPVDDRRQRRVFSTTVSLRNRLR